MHLPTLSLTEAVRLCSIIAGAGILFNALEYVLARREILERFYDWRIVRSRYYILIGRPTLGGFFDLIFATSLFQYFVVIHAAAAVLFPLVLGYSMAAAAVLAGIVLAVHCLSHIRLLVGMDGADQMQSVIWASLFLFCLPVNGFAQQAAAMFIGAQFVLSYLVSGWAKALSPVWRSGSAVHLITRTATYCTPQLSRWLRLRPVSFGLSWFTILVEVLGPFLLLAGRPGAVVLIALATAFHVGIASVMGLTTFVFAFCAAFPLLYYFSNLLA